MTNLFCGFREEAAFDISISSQVFIRCAETEPPISYDLADLVPSGS